MIDVLPVTDLPDDLPFGVVDARGGEGAFRYLERAVELALADEVHAVATAPLNKEAMHLAGFEYPGHTEILAELTGVRDYAMMLVADQLRVVHVSTHVALSRSHPPRAARARAHGHPARRSLAAPARDRRRRASPSPG